MSGSYKYHIGILDIAPTSESRNAFPTNITHAQFLKQRYTCIAMTNGNFYTRIHRDASKKLNVSISSWLVIRKWSLTFYAVVVNDRRYSIFSLISFEHRRICPHKSSRAPEKSFFPSRHHQDQIKLTSSFLALSL